VPNTASAQAAYVETGVGIADFLIGHANTYSQDSPDNANANYWNWGLFAQDDLRLTPRLTVNLGLRYDIQTAPTDVIQGGQNPHHCATDGTQYNSDVDEVRAPEAGSHQSAVDRRTP
jgi:outer membrane receptor protein involved in Fe transport